MMAVDPAPDGPEALRASLRVVEGRKPDRRSAADELHIELLTFFAECEVAARIIANAIVGLPVPSMLALNEANRIALRAAAARDEYLSLSGGDAA